MRPFHQLPGLGINPDSINFRNTTMDSDKTICIREDVGDARNIVIVDVATRVIKHKKPMAAEAAIMNAVREQNPRAWERKQVARWVGGCVVGWAGRFEGGGN